MSTPIRMTPSLVRKVQARMNDLGFGPLTVDGIRGRRTNAAITAFKRSVGLKPRSFIGPVTWAAMFPDQGGARPAPEPAPAGPDAPWMDEALRKMGLHEGRNNSALWSWLKSDGATVGDPAKIPWCGDFVETAIALSLPDEPLPVNPYLAANWVKAGIKCRPQYGAIMSFWRGSPSSWKGHVAFYVAEDDQAYHILGGNQANAVTITRIGKNRLRSNGCRWPSTAMAPTGRPRLVARGADPLSHNEA